MWPQLLMHAPHPRAAPTPTSSSQDLKCLVFSLIGLHFKIKPI
jgi:hypothetical protein